MRSFMVNVVVLKMSRTGKKVKFNSKSHKTTLR